MKPGNLLEQGIDVTKMGFEVPEGGKEFYFDPKRDLTEDDWASITRHADDFRKRGVRRNEIDILGQIAYLDPWRLPNDSERVERLITAYTTLHPDTKRIDIPNLQAKRILRTINPEKYPLNAGYSPLVDRALNELRDQGRSLHSLDEAMSCAGFREIAWEAYLADPQTTHVKPEDLERFFGVFLENGRIQKDLGVTFVAQLFIHFPDQAIVDQDMLNKIRSDFDARPNETNNGWNLAQEAVCSTVISRELQRRHPSEPEPSTSLPEVKNF